MAVAAAEARKFGAEEMRKDVAAFVEDASIPLPIENWRGTKRELTAHFARALAERIRQMPLPDGPAPTADARVALLAQQVVDALNECDHGGGGTPVGCAACEPMLAAMRKAGVELEDMATSWPYWRLRS